MKLVKAMPKRGLKLGSWCATGIGISLLCVTSAMAAGPVQLFPVGYSPTAAKDGSVYYFGGAGQRTQLLHTRFGGTTRKVDIAQLAKLGPRPQSIAVGGDGRIWASVYDNQTRRTTIYRVANGKVKSKVVLPRGHFASAMSSDRAGRTWLLGRNDGRLDYLTRNSKLRDVRVRDGGKLDAITRGPDGLVWASGKRVVKQISASGVKRSITVASTATAEIQSAQGYVWVTATGGVQRVSTAGTTFVPLQFASVTEQNGNSKSDFPSGRRMSLSLFTRPDGLLGFTAGAVLTAPEDEFSVANTSVGKIDSSGLISEVLPWAGSFGPPFSGPYFPADTNFDGAEGRTAGARMSAVDSEGNLWLSQLTDVASYRNGSW